jgi:hypothetical protein
LEQGGQLRPDRRGPAHADAGHCIESAVVRGGFQALQRIHLQLVVDALREPWADARDRLEEPHGIEAAAQSLELTPAASPEHLADRRGDARADPRQLVQSLQPLLLEERTQVPRVGEDGVRGLPVCIDAEGVRALRLQELRRLAQGRSDSPAIGGRSVDLYGHEPCANRRLRPRCG